MTNRLLLSLLLCWILPSMGIAQVKWLSFEDLDSAMVLKPKPVFIEMYTDWCTYCKKMEKEVFPEPAIAQILNDDFYAVSFNAESNEEVFFNGLNWQRSSSESFHSLALLFKPANVAFAPPMLVFLSPELELEEQVNAYQSRKMLLKKLRKYD